MKIANSSSLKQNLLITPLKSPKCRVYRNCTQFQIYFVLMIVYIICTVCSPDMAQLHSEFSGIWCCCKSVRRFTCLLLLSSFLGALTVRWCYIISTSRDEFNSSIRPLSTNKQILQLNSLSNTNFSHAKAPHNDVTYTLPPRLRGLESVTFQPHRLASVEQPDCSNSVPPTELVEEPLRWQPVTTTSGSIYVFSAFHDRRWTPTVVVIIALVSEYGTEGTRQRFCRMWFKGHSQPHLIAADFRFVPETHGRQYAAALYTCSLPPNRRSPPYSVSLVSSCSDITSNFLKVVDPDDANRSREAGTLKYTVCMALLHSNYSDFRRLIETVELNLMFGAQRIVIYDMSSSPDVQLVLDSYKHDGVLEMVPWNSLPLTSWDEANPSVADQGMQVHYFAQVAALNDCLYRNLLRSTFILFADVDEVVVPRDSSTSSDGSWTAMIEQATPNWLFDAGSKLFAGVYVINNVFYRPDAAQEKATGTGSLLMEWLKQDYRRLQSLITVEREDYVYERNVRSKYFVWSKAAVMIGIHFPYELIDPNTITTVYVSQNLGLLHHYREWSRLDNPSRQPQIIIDRWMDRYAVNLTHRVNQRCLAIESLTQMSSRA